MVQDDAWAEYLEEGETLLWQEQPVPGYELSFGSVLMMLVGLPFVLAGLYILVFLGRAIFSDIFAGGIVWMFGLTFVALGLHAMASPTILQLFRQRRTWYSLTNKRALIATSMPLTKKRLKSYPITIDSQINLEDGPLQTIYFATEITHHHGRKSSYRIGFERIVSGPEVYKLLNELRAEDLERRNAG